jgi:hypothetical protein
MYMTEIVQKFVYGDRFCCGMLASTTRIIYIGLPQANRRLGKWILMVVCRLNLEMYNEEQGVGDLFKGGRGRDKWAFRLDAWGPFSKFTFRIIFKYFASLCNMIYRPPDPPPPPPKYGCNGASVKLNSAQLALAILKYIFAIIFPAARKWSGCPSYPFAWIPPH